MGEGIDNIGIATTSTTSCPTSATNSFESVAVFNFKVGEFVVALCDDPQMFFIGEIQKISTDNNTCYVNFMARLKDSEDMYWVFPARTDQHWVQYASILDIRPQVDLALNLTTSRLVVMCLNNEKIIRNMAN